MSARLPTLPAAARNAGATKVTRARGNTFAVGYKVSGDLAEPGNAPAIIEALQAAWGERATITWGGTQADAIFVRF